MSPAIPTIALPATWKVLEHSRNQSATAVLAAGLTSNLPTVRHRCLKSLISRNDEVGYGLILLQWESYDSQDIALLRPHAHRFAVPARSILQHGSLQAKKTALSAVSDLDLTDSADILLEYVLDTRNPLHQSASECLLAMCQRWGRASRRSGTLTGSLRQLLIKKLHGPVLTNTRIVELMDAWLSLVHWDDSQQRSLLMSPGDMAYSRMLDRFSSTSDPSILQLLAGYFWRSTTPPSIQSIILEKAEPQLAIEMAQMVSDEALETVLDRLRDSPPLASVMSVDTESIQLEPAAYRRLLLMMAASREDFEWTLDTSVKISKGSSMDARQLAAEILLWCKRPSLEQFVRILQSDSLCSPQDQKLALSINEILQWLDGPSAILRQAAAHLFSDFTLEQLFKHVGVWPAQLCRIMAGIVQRREKNYGEALDDQLQSPSPKKRMAALQVIEWFQCADLVRDQLLSLKDDPRLEVRVRLIDTLSSLQDPILEELIPQLLKDANSDIADAAQRASRRLARQKSVPSES